RFDDRDAYAWHYLGYNLDRAGRQRREAEHAFRAAVEIRPDHPWYNGRLVTFLIEQARFRDAEQEWSRAVLRMDPHGEHVLTSPWLAREVHQWVVRAWLRFGEVRRARSVFDDIPEEPFCDQGWYRDLQHALLDAEEAVRLGESVYPAEMPMDKRWTLPTDLVSEHDAMGRPLRHWFPGRVVGFDDLGIHTALAVPEKDPSARRIIARTLSIEEWRQHGFCPAEEAEGKYLVLAIYVDPEGGEEVVQILPLPHRARAPDEDEIRHLTRYLEGSRA
ncbi:MAG: hypothetical protein IT372_36955, partial [Polyangiaceae bacterium]|nr:hypothetical protein [Polyangiaceae bacterium]